MTPASWQRWRGFAVPLLAVAAALLVVAFLALVVQLDDAVVSRPAFRRLIVPGYPDGISYADQALVFEAGLWWLCLSVLLWVVGLCAIGLCLVQLHSGTRHDLALRRRALRLLLSWVALAAAATAYLVFVRNLPLMPVRPLVEILDTVSAGLVRLASLNTALAYVVGVALLFGASLLLWPGVHGDSPARQMRAITAMMYGAAAFLMVWVSAATGMYRLAAMLLVPEARDPALKIAPTISLMGGLFLSLLLAVVYVSAGAWLQHCHERGRLSGDIGPAAADASSPKAFLALHWPKVAAILMPLLPGAAATVLQAMARVA